MSVRTLPIPSVPLRSEQLIKTWTQKYLNDEVDVWEFERGVWVALVYGSLSEDLDARGAPMRVPAYLRS